MTRVTAQEIRCLLGPYRPAWNTNIRHNAILRKVLKLFMLPELVLIFGPAPSQLRVAMGTNFTAGQLGKIQSNYLYIAVFNTLFYKKGNDYRVRNPTAWPLLQAEEQSWHDWIVEYFRRPRPAWALEPLPGLQRVHVTAPARIAGPPPILHITAPVPCVAFPVPHVAVPELATPRRGHAPHLALLTPPLSCPISIPGSSRQRNSWGLSTDAHQEMTPVSQWVHDGMIIERQQTLIVALLGSHREHPIQETWATISDLRDTLNVVLKKFREQQWSVYPRLKLSAIDMDEPELTAVQVPSYRIKHGHQPVSDEDEELVKAEVKLRCSEADNAILAVQAASLALSAVMKAREQDYRGQAGVTRSHRNVQKAELMKTFEITMYNRAQTALICLGHMAEDVVEPYPPLAHRDTWRKETHLHRAKGDSRLFNGTAWYLQSGTRISSSVQKTLLPVQLLRDDGERLQAQATTSPRKPKHLKDLAPENVVVESSGSETEGSDLEVSPSKTGNQQPGSTKCRKKKAKTKKSDGWIWLDRITSGQKLGEGKLAEYKEESDRVQWFRAEAEIYRWLEQYERKHAELMRVIERYRCDSEVWTQLAKRDEERGGDFKGAVAFACMQGAMYKRLQHNATKIFKKAEGAHADWVVASTFNELVVKIDNWRNVVFVWMDEMGIQGFYAVSVPGYAGA
ncbi:hypothetical protein K438DRAFT_1756241 [Mycena galopus ATCC 62051]|nr:hypothetical protein K438DRAFT_1756241 [Mycena galopus ATCC 62051]